MRNIVSDNDGRSLIIDKDILSSFENRSMLLYEILKSFGFNADQCRDMLTSAVGRHFMSSSHTAVINRASIEVAPHNSREESIHVIDLEDEMIEIPVRLEIKHEHNLPFATDMVNGKTSVAFSPEILQCSQVLLRHWREGDRFRPFGLHGSKLISDLFTDLKLTEKEKNDTWLLEADGEIVWVLGYRSSQSFKVSSNSTHYLLILLADKF